MRRHRLALLALAAFLAAAGAARAETAILVTKRLHPMPIGGDHAVQESTVDYLFRMSQGQRVWTTSATAAEGWSTPSGLKYSDYVTREPAEFHSSEPFRGVVELGGQGYGFVVDATRDRKYDLLRFDLNHNGDLTDDEVIQGRAWTSSSPCFEFPPIEVSLEIRGEQKEYAFFFYTNVLEDKDGVSVACAELQPAAYREGVVRLGGKSRRVVLVDYNCNGRFDDRVSLEVENQGEDGERSFPSGGDLLFIDPCMDDLGIPGIGLPSGDERQFVSRLARVDGRFYELDVDPGGERIDFKPVAAPLGRVENPNAPWCALVYGDQGLLEIGSSAGAPVELPEGEWRLLSYTIDLTEREDTARAPRQRSLFARLFGIGHDGPSPTRASARAPASCAPVKVIAGETVRLPFGPPFRGAVSAQKSESSGKVRLDLAIVGAAGEVCSDLRIAGERPPEPSFVITAPDGTEVKRGSFDFG
ncbi:MAG: hypothetical protein HY812_14350 [Planctomycetes bacterium]|nr:hypothetical protein [Planctomycetota bacterium]